MKILYKDLLKLAEKYAEKYGEDITNLYFGDNFVHGIKGDMLLKRIANGVYRDCWKDIRIELSEDNLSILILAVREGDNKVFTLAHHDY